MPGSTFGQAFRVTTAGESHGPANVVIIDGCPPGLPLSEEDIIPDLERRRPGQSKIVTQRKEPDAPEILSGVFEGETTGTPIAIIVRNQDQRSRDYANIKDVYRPGHADYTFDAKFGRRDYRGGGRSSARETVARVAAGAVAKKLISHAFGGEVLGYVTQVGDIEATIPSRVTLEQVETLPDGNPNVVRCPDPATAAKMVTLIEKMRKDQDSVGGVAEIVARNVPAGLGEPVFDKLKADLGKALFSLPAVLGVEYGAGFAVATARGSENNDAFETDADGNIRTRSNRHGGMLGWDLERDAHRAPRRRETNQQSSRSQDTVTSSGDATTIRTTGRHDPCLLPRFIPMAEAMIALVLADHWLRWRAIRD